MSGPKRLRTLPHLSSDAEAEAFVETSDLTQFDLAGAKPAGYEFRSKDTTISMRVSKELLEAVKERAAASGVPYQRFIRQALEEAVAGRKR